MKSLDDWRSGYWRGVILMISAAFAAGLVAGSFFGKLRCDAAKCPTCLCSCDGNAARLELLAEKEFDGDGRQDK